MSRTALPVGTIVPFAGEVEPEGWLFCYGQRVSSVQYKSHFIVSVSDIGIYKPVRVSEKRRGNAKVNQS